MYKFVIYFIVIIFIFTTHDVSAATFLKEIHVGQNAADMTFVGDLHKIYVNNAADATVSVIDTTTDSVIKTIQLPSESSPSFITSSHDGKEVYVVERLYGKIDVIRTSDDVVTHRIDTYSRLLNGVSVSPDDKTLYVASAEVRGIIRMTIIDLVTKTPIDYFDTVDAQEEMIISNDGILGYLGISINDSYPMIVYTDVIDLQSKTSVGKIQDTQIDIISPDGRIAWGHNFSLNTVSKIDLISKNVINTTPVAPRPSNPVVDDKSDPKYLFVPNDQSKEFTILDIESLAIIDSFIVGGVPVTAVVDKEAQKLYISVNDLGQIKVYNLRDLNLWGDSEDEVKKDMFDLIRELIAAVEGYGFAKPIDNAYMANLKKVEGMLEDARYTPAENQIRAFIQKLNQDVNAKKITQVQYDDLLIRAQNLLETIIGDARVTQP
jgi:YVTN family beta-propeller protein